MDTTLYLNILFLRLVVAIGSLILTLRSTTKQAWRRGLQNFKKQFEFKHMFYDAPPRSRYSFPKMIIASELKSTLRSSSHLSTISRRSEDMKMIRVALFTKRVRCWKYSWDYKLFILFVFFYEEFFYFECRLVDFLMIMIILSMQHWISKCKKSKLDNLKSRLSFLFYILMVAWDFISTYLQNEGNYHFYQVSGFKLILVSNYSKCIRHIKVEYVR